MSFNNITRLSIIIIICLSAFQCKKSTESTQQQLPDISIVDVSLESNWNYWVVGPEDYFYVAENNSIPESMLFRSSETGTDISIIFKTDGLVDKVVIDKSIYLFDNYDGSKIDIGVVSPNGDIEISRGVETNFDWDDYKIGFTGITDSKDIVNWVGKGAGAIPQGLKTAALASSTNLFDPTSKFVIGSKILDLSADPVATDKLSILGDITNFVDQYDMTKLAISCSSADYINCATDVASRAFVTLVDDQEEIASRNDDIQVVKGALQAGSGDVQITLTWDTDDDLDLWVTDPDGERIYYGNSTSLSGGELDFDYTDGPGPENIFWPQYGAPSGTYTVQVDHYSGVSANHYTVLVQSFGYIKQYEGIINPGETITVVVFQSNSTLPKIILNKIIVSEIKEPK